MNATAVFNDYSAPQTLAQALDSLEHLNVTIAASFEKISQSVRDKLFTLQTFVNGMIAIMDMDISTPGQEPQIENSQNQ